MKYTCKNCTNGALVFTLLAINKKGDEQVAFISAHFETQLQAQNLVYSPKNEWKFAEFITRLVFPSLSPGQ